MDLVQQYWKKKGFLRIWPSIFFITIKKPYRKWESFIIFLYMHRNVLSTRLESQEGRDRLKCLAIYVHQKTSSDNSNEGWSTKHLRFHWSLDPKNWRNQEDNDLYNQKHRGILTSVQQLKLEELHLFGIAFYFLNFFSYTKTSRD